MTRCLELKDKYCPDLVEVYFDHFVSLLLRENDQTYYDRNFFEKSALTLLLTKKKRQS